MSDLPSQRKIRILADNIARPQGRRTIRRPAPSVTPGNPMMPAASRQPRNIRMWDLGDGAPGTTKERLRLAYNAALNAVDSIEARKADTLRSGKFTPSGAADDALKYALTDLVPSFKRGRDTIQTAKREVASLRDKIKPQPTDKTDVVGAIRRWEMREFLRAMPDKARRDYIGKRRENIDPELALAVVELPSEFSGVLETDRNELLDHALRSQHGDAMEQLVELERAIEVAESAVETGRDEVRQETGLPAHAFNERAAQIEGKRPTPWLRREGDQTVVVELDKRVARPATPEEIATGAFYRDFDEFRNSNPGFSVQSV
jgi:hypothetical protein